MISYKFTSMPIRKLVAILCFCLGLPVLSQAGGFLSAEDAGIITAGTVGIFVLGHHVKRLDSSKTPLIGGPILFDRKLQRFLGGDCSADKTNFLDSEFGSAVTPVAAALIMFTADSKWPQADKQGKLAVQNLFLYTTGLLATKGITDLAKGIVARPRPLPCLEPELAGLRTNIDHAYDHNSFFSGHASSAFFAMTFLNKRIRAIMRNEMTVGKYDKYSWVSPATAFSWATFVGWTRIHAYKHFPTDIIVGAAAGILMAELFYSFNDYNAPLSGTQPQAVRQLFSIRLTF